jgi:hypothetical protein
MGEAGVTEFHPAGTVNAKSPAEKVAASSAGATGLLPFLHPRIAGEQSVFLELGTQRVVEFEQGARDGQAGGTGLAVDSAAGCFDRNVDALLASAQFERAEDGGLQAGGGKVVVELAAVDFDFAGAGFQTDAGDGGAAAAAGGVDFGHGQETLSSLGCCAACGCSLPA